MTKNNILLEKSLTFAARIVKLNKYLVKAKHHSLTSGVLLYVFPQEPGGAVLKHNIHCTIQACL